jgi:lysine N-acyltransferase
MTDAEPIQRREVTDVPDEVRDVPPPIPELPAPYGLRLADPDADAELIAEWMNRPHLAESWEYAWPAARWRLHLRAQLESGFCRPFVASSTESTVDTSNYTGQQRISLLVDMSMIPTI